MCNYIKLPIGEKRRRSQTKSGDQDVMEEGDWTDGKKNLQPLLNLRVCNALNGTQCVFDEFL